MVTVSAPGKIHLMGEHAVVYGYPALLAAINRRVTVSVEKTSSAVHEIISPEPVPYVQHILSLVEKEYHLTIPSLTITVTSQFPAGFHLGSSAAVAVATIGAVTYFVKQLWNPVAINKLAYEAEKFVHGNPSGGDNTACTFGGIIWYRKELEFLKSIWQLPFRPHPDLSHFCLINTGSPKESTKDMVAMVARKMKEDEKTMQEHMHINEVQTRRIAGALKAGDEAELIQAMQTGSRTLVDMGVVSPTAAECIRSVEDAGGAAKILGGGGRAGSVGFLLCYHRDEKKLTALAGDVGYNVEHIILGEEGVRLEQKE